MFGMVAVISVPKPRQIECAASFRSVVTGAEFTMALDVNNMVWCFGSNTYGQLCKFSLVKFSPIDMRF
jgi:alpha-tubulin suppressor-like RCC1 family protein